jgi:ATP-dependent exoDNAse (exonuclease V) beta subunit
MKIVDKYVYPKSSRANIAGLRHYTLDGTEEKLPSVTTVLGNTQPKEKQESLERWRERVGLREAQKITRDAAIRGTAMHKYLEDLIRGDRSLDLTPLGVEATKMAEIIVDHGLSYVDEVYGIEATLYYPGLYAGSVDLIGRYKDKVSIIDFKQTAAIRGTAMHKYLEDLIRGDRSLDLTPLGVEATKMAEIIVDHGLSYVDEVYGIEATLYYPGLYAGSVDLIGRYKDKISIIDFKQTNKPKQREWIGDYFLQMAAYGMAHDAVYGTNIEQGVIMMCSKDGFYQQFVIEGEEFRDANTIF